MKTLTKFSVIILLSLFLSTVVKAQQGFGTSTPAPSSVIDAVSNNKGVLLPRVALTSTIVAAPVTAPANSLTVFNTATTGDVTPGYYYWSEDKVTPANSKWVKLATSNDMLEPWKIQGTANNATENTDNIYQQGKVSIGSTSATTATLKQLEVVGDFKTRTATGTGIETKDPGNGYRRVVLFNSENSVSSPVEREFSEDAIANEYTNTGANIVPETVLDLDRNTLNAVVKDNSNGGLAAIHMMPGSLTQQVGYTGPGSAYFKMDPGNIMLVSQRGNYSNLTGIYLTLNNGINFQFANSDTGIPGNYMFPRTNGTANQVLTTDGTGNAQLSWKDVSTLVTPEPLQIQGTTNKATANTDAVYQMGNFAIGKTTSNSNFEVAGSVSHSIRVITANDALLASDYTVISRAAGAISLTLPDPTACKGRVYYIINNGAAGITTSRAFEVSTGNTQTNIPNAATGIQSPNPNFGNKYMLQSDGAIWVLISLG